VHVSKSYTGETHIDGATYLCILGYQALKVTRQSTITTIDMSGLVIKDSCINKTSNLLSKHSFNEKPHAQLSTLTAFHNKNTIEAANKCMKHNTVS